eukprot:scaffold300337_cov17-Tisochrysis_lutea.AAC.1
MSPRPVLSLLRLLVASSPHLLPVIPYTYASDPAMRPCLKPSVIWAVGGCCMLMLFDDDKDDDDDIWHFFKSLGGFIKPAFEHPSPLFCPSRDWPILAEQGESPTAL